MESSKADRGEKHQNSSESGVLSFDRRLAQAESRLKRDDTLQGGADASSDEKSGKGGDSLMGLAARIGTEMIAAVVVGALIGYGLDRVFGFRALFLVIFALVGGIGGTLNVLRAVNQIKF